MKHLVFVLLLIKATIAPVMALPDKELVISGSDGKTACAVKDIRRIVFDDGRMLVDMKDGSLFSWNTDWVNCIMLGSYESKNETTVPVVGMQAFFAVEGSVVRVDSSAPVAVQLSSCDGRVLYGTVCNGRLSFDMCSLPAGIYILMIDGITYKIMNR